MTHILKAELLASSRAKECAEPYRAVLVRGEIGAIIKVEQPIRGEWHGCGSWYLSTLIHYGRVSDSISIDYGQNWNIDSGLKAAVNEALLFLADEYKK